MVVLALAVAALAVLLAVNLALALRLRQRLSSLRTQPETTLNLSLLTQSETLTTQETLSDVDINPLATAPPGRITIYIVDGPSNQVMRSAVVSNLEDGDMKKKYQTYDIFKKLYISHVMRQAPSCLQHPSIENQFSGKGEYYQTLKTTDLVVVVDDVKRNWNTEVAGDEGIHEGAMVFIWPKELWMEKQGMASRGFAPTWWP
jgi:hypothetical protein